MFLTFISTVLTLFSLFLRDQISAVPWLPWLAINLTLAWVPLLLSSIAGSSPLALLLILPVWLIFLPNAPYLVTDLIYLPNHIYAPLDVILLCAVAALGLWIGVLSFHQMTDAIRCFWGPVSARVATVAVPATVGLGVYIGRILRWNSWDMILQPRELALSLLGLVQNPILNINAWAFIIVFGALFFAISVVTKWFLI